MAKKKTDEPLPRTPRGLPLAPAELHGKSAQEPEVVRWVARNIDEPNPDPLDCPDPFAWTLLRGIREGTIELQFFLEKLWVKLIPARSQLDQDAGGSLDGQDILDQIEKIRAMSMKAKGLELSPRKRPPPRVASEVDEDLGYVFDPDED